MGGLKADCPHARESAAGHSTGLLNVHRRVAEAAPAASQSKLFTTTVSVAHLLPSGDRVCAVLGCTFEHTRRLHRGEQVGRVT